MKFKPKSINPIWIHRLLRLAFGAIFIAVGLQSNGELAPLIFGAIFIITAFLKPIGCLGGNCTVDEK